MRHSYFYVSRSLHHDLRRLKQRDCGLWPSGAASKWTVIFLTHYIDNHVKITALKDYLHYRLTNINVQTPLLRRKYDTVTPFRMTGSGFSFRT